MKVGGKAGAGGRWALSFADLCLLLLGFFVLLQARPDKAKLTAGLREALGAHPQRGWKRPAHDLFEPGEAILRRNARAELRALTAKGRITVVSRGTDPATNRFDAWELAAARAAAVARALSERGIAQERIAIDLAPGDPGGQTLAIVDR